MSNHPVVNKVQRRVRVQQRMLKTAVGGLLLGAISGGLIALGAYVFHAEVLKGVGIGGILLSVLIVILGLLAYLVAGLFVRSAVKELDGDALLSQPLQEGEQFGRMKVVECEGTRLALAMEGSPLVAGLWRLIACLLLLVAGVGIGVMMLVAGKYSLKAGFFVGLLIVTAVVLASVPFAMMWTAGPLQPGTGGSGDAAEGDGATAIEIERVRWFFKRDVMTVRPEQIDKLFMNGMYLTLHTRGLGVVALARTSGTSILDRWNKQRLIVALQGALGAEVRVEEKA